MEFGFIGSRNGSTSTAPRSRSPDITDTHFQRTSTSTDKGTIDPAKKSLMEGNVVGEAGKEAEIAAVDQFIEFAVGGLGDTGGTSQRELGNNESEGMDVVESAIMPATKEDSRNSLDDDDAEEDSEDEEDDIDESSLMDDDEEDGISEQNENILSSLPSSKNKRSASDTETESGASSIGASPPKKKRVYNPNMREGLKHHRHLKMSGEPFPQEKSCEELVKRELRRSGTNQTRSYYIGKCIDCKQIRGLNRVERKAKECRFIFFRMMFYEGTTTRSRSGNKKSKRVLKIKGFPDVSAVTPTSADYKLWLPVHAPKEVDVECAKFLLCEVGDQFCQLVKQENDTLGYIENLENPEIIWRKQVDNLRELCDVCSTTLFNFHWTCEKCGFGVCISCFQARKMNSDVPERANNFLAEKDHFGWLKCHKGEHELDKLRLTQRITRDALNMVNFELHDIRKKLGIPQDCDCDIQFDPAKSDSSEWLRQFNLKTQVEGDGKAVGSEVSDATSVGDAEKCAKEMNVEQKTADDDNSDSKLETVQHNGIERNGVDDDGGDDDDDFFKMISGAATDPVNDAKNDEEENDDFFNMISGADDNSTEGKNPNENITGLNGQEVASPALESCLKASSQTPDHHDPISSRSILPPPPPEMILKHFERKGGSSNYKIKVHPKRIMSLSESRRQFPNVPHVWHNGGWLLRLLEPNNPENLKLFREQWKRGQPVMVSNVADNLNKDLWSPQSFSRDFGHKTNPLINCMTGKLVNGMKIKEFWDGFENVKDRKVDDSGVKMLLKLKDWPPGADFAEVCKSRFEDLMKSLPLGEYTYRDGVFNLATRPPDAFSKPDLGPKMYIAYGSGLHLDKGTTNLHLDVSDAANVMVHVGEVTDEDPQAHRDAVMKAIEESDCDDITIRRVKENKELPGALWHIWEAKDADKIRDMLNKMNLEKGVRIERHHDAIHDQSCYLDSKLRQKLREDYNVQGYPILQCAGDAVFIPAGAPHQVRNLNNCIKIAEDFVSPENVRHCFYLTEEFRNLTETHTNHEDKLQIKNIVYHSVKDAIAVIKKSMSEKAGSK